MASKAAFLWRFLKERKIKRTLELASLKELSSSVRKIFEEETDRFFTDTQRCSSFKNLALEDIQVYLAAAEKLPKKQAPSFVSWISEQGPNLFHDLLRTSRRGSREFPEEHERTSFPSETSKGSETI